MPDRHAFAACARTEAKCRRLIVRLIQYGTGGRPAADAFARGTVLLNPAASKCARKQGRSALCHRASRGETHSCRRLCAGDHALLDPAGTVIARAGHQHFHARRQQRRQHGCRRSRAGDHDPQPCRHRRFSTEHTERAPADKRPAEEATRLPTHKRGGPCFLDPAGSCANALGARSQSNKEGTTSAQESSASRPCRHWPCKPDRVS
jgi:hypothetical protein